MALLLALGGLRQRHAGPQRAAPAPSATHHPGPPPGEQQIALAARGVAGGSQVAAAPQDQLGSLAAPVLQDVQLRQQLGDAAGALLSAGGEPLPAVTMRHALAHLLDQAGKLPGDDPWRQQLRDRFDQSPATDAAPAAPWAATTGSDQWGSWADCDRHGYQQRFRWCPAGAFVHLLEDGTRHQIRLSQGFWLADHETTVRQYLVVRQQKGVPSEVLVTEVSWLEAAGFCQELRRYALAATLPSEAQWELA